MQQCLYLRPLPQGQGAFLPIFASAWRGISLRHYRAGLWKGKGDTGRLFFREENQRVQINECSTRRAVTLQPTPTLTASTKLSVIFQIAAQNLLREFRVQAPVGRN